MSRRSTFLSADARLAKQARKTGSAASSAASTRPGTPSNAVPKVSLKKGAPPALAKTAAPGPVNQLRADMEAMGLVKPEKSLKEQEKMQVEQQKAEEETPVLSLSKEKVLEEIRAKEKDEKPVLSLVVVGTSPFSAPFDDG